MKAMKAGDKVFFYHSNCKVPGIAGIMEVWKEAYPDCMALADGLLRTDTARDPSHPYYDEKTATKDEPTWFMVDVKFVRTLKRLIPLKELQEYKDTYLKDMTVVGKGRLSVQSVKQKEWEFILRLEEKAEE
jgi:predicted RNA-binding protein with PUA-like domain